MKLNTLRTFSIGAFFLGAISLAATAAGPLLIQPIPLRPLPRPINVKPAFRNIIYRGIAKQSNYGALQFLTDPAIRDDFSPQALSPASAQLFQAFRADLLQNKENFNAQGLAKLVGSLGTELNSQDIESLVFIVLMEASQSAGEDLKAIMASVKAINSAKQALRGTLQALQGLVTNCQRNPALCRAISLQALEQDLAKANAELDGLNDISNSQQLKLQQLADQRAKAMETLSNILKKMDQTAESLVENLK